MAGSSPGPEEQEGGFLPGRRMGRAASMKGRRRSSILQHFCQIQVALSALLQENAENEEGSQESAPSTSPLKTTTSSSSLSCDDAVPYTLSFGAACDAECATAVVRDSFQYQDPCITQTFRTGTVVVAPQETGETQKQKEKTTGAGASSSLSVVRKSAVTTTSRSILLESSDKNTRQKPGSSSSSDESTSSPSTSSSSSSDESSSPSLSPSSASPSTSRTTASSSFSVVDFRSRLPMGEVLFSFLTNVDPSDRTVAVFARLPSHTKQVKDALKLLKVVLRAKAANESRTSTTASTKEEVDVPVKIRVDSGLSVYPPTTRFIGPDTNSTSTSSGSSSAALLNEASNTQRSASEQLQLVDLQEERGRRLREVWPEERLLALRGILGIRSAPFPWIRVFKNETSPDDNNNVEVEQMEMKMNSKPANVFFLETETGEDQEVEQGPRDEEDELEVLVEEQSEDGTSRSPLVLPLAPLEHSDSHDDPLAALLEVEEKCDESNTNSSKNEQHKRQQPRRNLAMLLSISRSRATSTGSSISSSERSSSQMRRTRKGQPMATAIGNDPTDDVGDPELRNVQQEAAAGLLVPSSAGGGAKNNTSDDARRREASFIVPLAMGVVVLLELLLLLFCTSDSPPDYYHARHGSTSYMGSSSAYYRRHGENDVVWPWQYLTHFIGGGARNRGRYGDLGTSSEEYFEHRPGAPASAERRALTATERAVQRLRRTHYLNQVGMSRSDMRRITYAQLMRHRQPDLSGRSSQDSTGLGSSSSCADRGPPSSADFQDGDLGMSAAEEQEAALMKSATTTSCNKKMNNCNGKNSEMNKVEKDHLHFQHDKEQHEHEETSELLSAGRVQLPYSTTSESSGERVASSGQALPREQSISTTSTSATTSGDVPQEATTSTATTSTGAANTTTTAINQQKMLFYNSSKSEQVEDAENKSSEEQEQHIVWQKTGSSMYSKNKATTTRSCRAAPVTRKRSRREGTTSSLEVDIKQTVVLTGLMKLKKTQVGGTQAAQRFFRNSSSSQDEQEELLSEEVMLDFLPSQEDVQQVLCCNSTMLATADDDASGLPFMSPMEGHYGGTFSTPNDSFITTTGEPNTD
ncbi:unnamed protein product [Amoebophrya sp. A25]|nr:unnamed protein product [Amoebophrya sp. A25]|eukprot:GSA25T00006487001.1